MSLIFPYDPSFVLASLSDIFSINLSSLTTFESLIITILSNLYFFIYWFVIIYFSLKILNRLYERLF